MDNDGGFLIASESVTSTSRGNPMNRWDYYNSPYMSPGAYYANPYALNYSYYPWSYPYLGATNPYQMLRYYAENIVVLSFDSSITTQWSNVVYKSQYDDNTDNFLGYTILNTGSDLHFVFNKMERRANLLSDQIITPDGQLHTTPTMHNLDNNYTFMPKRAKQVGSHQLLIPCAYRSYICFAKVDL
jgi:hypothetical protein